MRGLASFVMRGRGQATLVVATTAVLSALVPPVSWLSSGGVALVTLRRGGLEGEADARPVDSRSEDTDAISRKEAPWRSSRRKA